MAFLTSYIASDDSNDVSDHQAHVRQQMVDFWSKATLHAYECASGLSLDVGVLAKTSLAWHGAVAPGLEIAVRSMISTGKLVARGDIEVTRSFYIPTDRQNLNTWSSPSYGWKIVSIFLRRVTS